MPKLIIYILKSTMLIQVVSKFFLSCSRDNILFNIQIAPLTNYSLKIQNAHDRFRFQNSSLIFFPYLTNPILVDFKLSRIFVLFIRTHINKIQM